MAEEHKNSETESLEEKANSEAAPEEQAPADDKAEEKGLSRIEELEAEIARLKESQNKAVLAAAEYDNAAKRAQRELRDSRKFGSASLARDLLGVVDNLQRALGAVPEEALKDDEQLRTLVEGVRLIERELLQAFSKHEIEIINPIGEPFDPHFHEAMFEAPVPGKADGTVIEVLQSGYRLHERLLRPARVGVAKGGAGAPAAPGAEIDTKV